MKLNQLALAAVAALPSAVSAASIYEIAGSATDFSTLAAAVDAAGLADTLSGDGTFTVFAPNDDAFAKVPAEVVTKLLDPIWQPQLQDVLLYHTLGSVVHSTDLTDGLTVTTLNGEDITINLDPARVNDASNIVAADIIADNGIIHGIDAVLAPTSLTSNIVDLAVATDDLSTLVAAVTAAGLGDALSGDGPLTVFAPTNEAFAALPEGTVESLLLPENIDQLVDILKYHVVAANAHSSGLSSGNVETLNGDNVEVTVSDRAVTVNDATVATADVIASNGIIHIIDKVLMPPADETPATLPATTEAPIIGSVTTPASETPGSIYEIAGNAEDFSTLAAAVDAAGLADTLSGDGTFTVFAPNNDAFAKVPAEVVTKLLDPIWQPQLQDVLLYHTLGSVVLSTDLTDGLTATTLNGEDITINLDPARVNDASNIFAADIIADNGVIHGIDAVLAPTSLTSNIVDLAVATDDLSTLVAAVTAAGLGDALSGDGPLTVFAPTNEAFAALPEGTVESLLLPENIDQLVDILKYHVVAANAHSSGLSSGNVETLNGDSVEVTVSDGGVMVNDATVATADVIASNGIIHIIDKVLMPPTDETPASKSPVAAPSTSTDTPTTSTDTPTTESPVPAPSKSPTSASVLNYSVEGTMLSLVGSVAMFFLCGF